MRVAGLMSGTSADGVDVAIVDIAPRGIKVLACRTYPYPQGLGRTILNLFHSGAIRLEDICHLNFAIAEVFAASLIRLSKKSKIHLNSIDLIGSHGQTIYHIPRGKKFAGRIVRSTLQIGEPSVIAERTGITTVADFRPRDIAAGGQGAPLVPYADYVLFRHRRKNRLTLNIGGIANITYLPADCRMEEIIAFDTGPGNMVIDRMAYLVGGGKLSCDKHGKMAARGKVNDSLLDQLMRHPYLRRPPPKSTGREEFGAVFSDIMYQKAKRRRIAPEDMLATVTAFTVKSISEACRRYLPGEVDEVIVGGGGTRNRTIMRLLKDGLYPASVKPTDDFGISADAKEAVSFAILARETIRGVANNVPSATGAQRAVVLGKVIPGTC